MANLLSSRVPAAGLFAFLQGRQGPRRGGGLLASEIETEREAGRTPDAGLLGPAPNSRSGPGGLLSQAPRRRQAAAQRLRQAPQALQAAPQAQQAPGGASVAAQGQGGGRPADQLRRASQASIAQLIARHNNGELPPSSESFIREVTEDNVSSGPGQKGRGFLSRLFAGDKVPGLSEAANNRIRNEALVTAGLSLLGSNARNWGQALASGIFLARQQAAQTAGELLDERRNQQRLIRRYSVLANTDMTELERWKEIRRRSAAEGDLDAAETAQSVISDLRDRQAGEGERTPQVLNGRLVFTDDQGQAFDASGRKLEAEDLPQPEPDRVKPIERTRVLPDGREISFLADPFTGQPIQGSEVVTGAGGEGGPDEEELFQRTNALADDFRTETRDIQESLALAESAKEAGDNSAGDLRLIFVFNKLIDPGSRITEGEVQAGKNLGGLSAQARGFLDKRVEGRLPPAAREELEGEIANMLQSRTEQLSGIANQFQQRAQRFGVNPNFVVRKGLIPELTPEGEEGRSFSLTGGQSGAQSENDILEEIYGGS